MAISTYLIPLSGIPETFVINLAGVEYTMTVKWNDSDFAGWVIDIADSAQNPIVAGITMVTGTDLLAQYAYLGIQGSLIVYTDGDASAVPTLDNLGTNCNLYFQTSVANG